MDIKFLELLSEKYPSRKYVINEIIGLKSTLYLPKGTEYFFSDLHGESDSFIHLLKSASGNIRDKVRQLYGNNLTISDQDELSFIITNTKEFLDNIDDNKKNTPQYRKVIINRLVELFRFISTKYPKLKVKRKLPIEYKEILDELLYVNNKEFNKKKYYEKIIDHIVEYDHSNEFIKAISYLIQKISVDSLHIIGDIFDRGPNPHIIMNELIEFKDVDYQWGNHDIEWMGAFNGNDALVSTIISNAVQYNNFDMLEDGYGINLRPLFEFAIEEYKNDDCNIFAPRIFDENKYDNIDKNIVAKMHKAISIIRFKLEGALIEKHPEYNMDDRNVLKHINYDDYTYKNAPLKDKNLPTINKDNPLMLTKKEKEVINILSASLRRSNLLKQHINHLYQRGSTYKIVNSNLLFHGCIPMTKDGDFEKVEIDGKYYYGKNLMDKFDHIIRSSFKSKDKKLKEKSTDMMWYLWAGPKSPMFGKSQFSAFENLFIDDEKLKKEYLNPYFKLSKKEEICNKIFDEFNMDKEKSHIINGHVPVKTIDGQKCVNANGKLYIIDGGISKPYQKKTGIAGYTLIFNSHHMALAEHRSFSQIKNDIGNYIPKIFIIEKMKERLLIKDTDYGNKLREVFLKSNIMIHLVLD